MTRVNAREPETIDDLNFDAECNWLINQLMEPFKQSYQHLQIVCKQGYQYLETEWLDRKVQPLPTDPKVSAARIFSRLGLGFILLIPIINIVAFAILKALNITSLIFSEGRTWGSLLGCGDEDLYLEAYYQQAISGKALILEGFKLPEVPKVSNEEYIRRRELCIKSIKECQKKAATKIGFNDNVLEFNFEAILKQYDKSYSPQKLEEFYDFAKIAEADREKLNQIFAYYENRKNPDEKVQYAIRMLSVIYGFLNTHKDSFKDPKRQTVFIGLIRAVFYHIINGHKNCLDQVNSQFETLILDTIRSINHKIQNSKETLKEYLCRQASYEIYRYKIRLIKEIISSVCKNYEHQADLERALAHRVAKQLGLSAQSGAIVKYLEKQLIKVANDFMLIYSKRFNPEKFLLDNLQSSSKSLLGDLRNNILYWASKNFGLEEDVKTIDGDPKSDISNEKFAKAISEDENPKDGTFADEGADLKLGVLIFYLKEIGIFKALGSV